MKLTSWIRARAQRAGLIEPVDDHDDDCAALRVAERIAKAAVINGPAITGAAMANFAKDAGIGRIEHCVGHIVELMIEHGTGSAQLGSRIALDAMVLTFIDGDGNETLDPSSPALRWASAVVRAYGVRDRDEWASLWEPITVEAFEPYAIAVLMLAEQTFTQPRGHMKVQVMNLETGDVINALPRQRGGA